MEYLYGILHEQYDLLNDEGRTITKGASLWRVVKYYIRVQFICTLIDTLEYGCRVFGEEENW